MTILMFLDSLDAHQNQKRKSRKKKKKTKQDKHKKNYLLLLAETMEERRRYIGVTLNISLSYLHESQSSLCLQRNKNYIKRK